LIAALIAIVLINCAPYLAYFTYDDVFATRFLLPAQVALFILLAAAVHDAVVAVARFDALSPADAEPFVESLVRRRYQPVLVVDGPNESGTYGMALRGTIYERID
jgi:hypothetical protein